MDDDMWNLIDSVPGWMDREECEYLQSVAKDCWSWTEVGVYCGRSALAVALALPWAATLQLVEKAMTVSEGLHRDIDAQKVRDTLPLTLQLISKMRPDLDVAGIWLPSVEASKVAADSDCVFIDADHSYASVRDDILAWAPKCTILMGHDYSQTEWQDVKKAVNELVPDVSSPAGTIWRRQNGEKKS